MIVREALLAASRSTPIKAAAAANPLARGVVSRFVAGEDTASAVAAAKSLSTHGLYVTIDHLGEEDADNPETAAATVLAYSRLLEALDEADLADRAEVSIKLSAIGQALAHDGAKVATENAHRIAGLADAIGTTITIDMEDHTTTDLTLATVVEVRKDYPSVGAVIQAYLKRSEADCRDFNGEGSRVRLCKGAYAEPGSVAYESRQEVDLSYVRCTKALMNGQGVPMLATHDPRLIEIGTAIAVRAGRNRGGYEFQMLYGVRPDEQARLAAMGEKVRVYVPFGPQWYPYLVRRMAEKPANLALFVKSLSSKS